MMYTDLTFLLLTVWGIGLMGVLLIGTVVTLLHGKYGTPYHMYKHTIRKGKTWKS